MRKWIACMVPALLAAAWLLVPAAVMAADSDLRLSVSAGLDDRAKPLAWVPLIVEIENSGPETAGELVLDQVPQMWGPPAAYMIRHSLPVALPAGAHKRFTLYAPADPARDTVTVRLLVNGAEAARASARLRLVGQVLVGLLGAQREDLAALAALSLPDRRDVGLIRLDPATLPDRVEALLNLDALVIANFSAAELTDAQRAAIRNWVYEGGQLVLVGGPEAYRTLTPWQDWLPLRLTGQGRADLAPVGRLAGTPIAAMADISHAEVGGARVLAAAGDQPLVAAWARGAGQVYYLAFDPTLEPFYGWDGAAGFWGQLLQPAVLPAHGRSGPDRDRQAWSDLSRAAQQIPGAGLPALSWIRIGLAAYVLLLGPVSFLILRRLRRAEWAWLTAPALVLLFSGGAWAQARTADTARIMAHQVSLVQLDEYGPARVRTLLGLFLPANTGAEVAFDRSLPLEIPVPDGPYYGRTGDTLPVGAEVGGGGTGPVRLRPLGLWTMRTVAARQELPLGALEADLSLQGNTLTGTVINRTGVPLKEVTVMMGINAVSVGDLDPGARAGVQLRLDGMVQPMGYEVIATALRNTGQVLISRGGPQLPEQRDWLRRLGLAAALDRLQYVPGRPLVLGWADWSPGGTTLNGQPLAPQATAVFVQQVGYRVGPGSYAIPPGMLLARPVAWESEDYGEGPAGWGVPLRGSVTVEFSLPVPAAAVQRMQLDVPLYERRPAGDLAAEIWDWQAGAWAEAAFDGQAAAVAEPARYIDEHQTVRVRITRAGRDTYPTGIPTLSISGEVGG